MRKFDYLVIGGGIAGLTYALKVAEHGSVAVLFKKSKTDSSTSWAQGGIAAVSSQDDDFSLHIDDTLKAGDGLCNEEIVDLVIHEGPQRINELIGYGAKFDKDEKEGSFHLHREGGHSRRRIYHTADATGYEVQSTLNRAAKSHSNIEFFENAVAIDLITTQKMGIEVHKNNKVLGAYVLMPSNKIEVFAAKKVLIATGGAGKVYLYTSNPDVASGDGVAMCFRAGVPVANLEFYQFHPTCLYHPEAKTFLITEAMRGEGAKLKRLNGEEFMKRYHKDAELAPRDIVARAIDNEMKTHGEKHVYLDITHKEGSFIKEHFPTIYEKCKGFGFDITSEPIPVVPAAHFCCGGVVSDQNGATAVNGLYVAGECAHTGLHGANRLASNGLLEGMVFGSRAACHSIENSDQEFVEFSIPDWDAGASVDSDEQVIINQNWDEIRRFMWNFVGIVRTNKRMERALRRSNIIQQEINEYYWNFTITSDLVELRNLSLVAELMIRSAMSRKESRGLHYTLDYPEISEAFAHDTILTPAAFNPSQGRVGIEVSS